MSTASERKFGRLHDDEIDPHFEDDELHGSSCPMRWFGISRYQFLVLVSAFLAWGLDLFDAFLFTYAAPSCIPSLLHLNLSDPQTPHTVAFWTSLLTALLLVGWGIGGIAFGILVDRMGRTKTMIFTILVYSASTAMCAVSWSIYWLLIFRFISSLCIGGEYAAGASLVGETMPPKKRVMGGVLMYTSAPIGSLAAWFVNYIVDRFFPSLDLIDAHPYAWRFVFLTALIPVALALFVQWNIKDSGQSAPVANSMQNRSARDASFNDLFRRPLRKRTIGSIFVVFFSLVTWWCTATFVPVYCKYLAARAYDVKLTPSAIEIENPEVPITDADLPVSPAVMSSPVALQAQLIDNLARTYLALFTIALYVGGVCGALVVIPLTERMRRKSLYQLYFSGSAVFIVLVFWYSTSSVNYNIIRIGMIFFLGAFSQGLVAIHSFYLPEQFPTYIRGRGAGLTYNASRMVTAVFPFLIGLVIGWGNSPLTVISFVAVFPVIGAIFLIFPVAIETKNMDLYSADTDWEMEVDLHNLKLEEHEQRQLAHLQNGLANGTSSSNHAQGVEIELHDVNFDDSDDESLANGNSFTKKVYPQWPPPPSTGYGIPGSVGHGPWIIDEILDIDDGQGLGNEIETIDGFVELGGDKKQRLHWNTTKQPEDFVDS